MAEFPAMMLWTDAYLADTTHLGTEEHGAYLLLLMAAWRSPACALRDDDVFLARICRCTKARWQERLRPTIEPFFTIADGFWTQKRLSREKQHAETVRSKRVAAAQAKHLKNKETASAHAGANGGAKPSYPYPTTTSTREDKGETPLKPPRSPTKAGSFLPADWEPDAAAIQFALNEGLTNDDVRRELGRFRDYWASATGARARKSDWPACWRNWIRRAAENLGRPAGRSGGDGGGGGRNGRAPDRPAGRLADTLAVLHRRGSLEGCSIN